MKHHFTHALTGLVIAGSLVLTGCGSSWNLAVRKDAPQVSSVEQVDYGSSGEELADSALELSYSLLLAAQKKGIVEDQALYNAAMTRLKNRDNLFKYTQYEAFSAADMVKGISADIGRISQRFESLSNETWVYLIESQEGPKLLVLMRGKRYTGTLFSL